MTGAFFINVYSRNKFVNKDKINAVLAPDHFSQAAYTGKVKQTETIIIHAEDGTPLQRDITFYISWDSICEILALIRKRYDT